MNKLRNDSIMNLLTIAGAKLNEYMKTFTYHLLAHQPSHYFLAQIPKDDDDSFLFGSYSPSAASTGRARARPDTAPGSRRSVRFSDELGLGDEVTGIGARPATAPDAKTDSPTRRRRPMGEKADLGNLSLVNDSNIKQGTEIIPLTFL